MAVLGRLWTALTIPFSNALVYDLAWLGRSMVQAWVRWVCAAGFVWSTGGLWIGVCILPEIGLALVGLPDLRPFDDSLV